MVTTVRRFFENRKKNKYDNLDRSVFCRDSLKARPDGCHDKRRWDRGCKYEKRSSF